MTDKEWAKVLQDILSKASSPHMKFSEIERLLTSRGDEPRNDAEQAGAIRHYIKTILFESPKMKELLAAIVEKRRLQLVCLELAKIDYGDGGWVANSAERDCVGEIARLDEQINRLYDETRRERRVLKKLTETLVTLKGDGDFELPDVNPKYPSLGFQT
jgi:hypothetical protein